MTNIFEEDKSIIRTPLINRVSPKQGESLYSYMFRNAEANYFESLGVMLKGELKSCNIYWYHYSYLDFDKKWTNIITKFVEEEILYKEINKLCLNQFDNIIFGSKLPTKGERDYFYVQSQAKYCPLCFREDKHHKLIWDLSFVTVCPKHNVNLVNTCHTCHKPIRIGQLMQDCCQCGSHFTSQIHRLDKPDKKILETQLHIQNYFLNQIDLAPSDKLNLSSQDYFYCFRLLINVLLNLPLKKIFNNSKLNIESLDWWSIKHDIQAMSHVINAIHQTIMSQDNFIPKIMEIIDKYKENTSAYKRKYKLIQNLIDFQKSIGEFKINLSDTNKYISQSEAKLILKTDMKSIQNLCTSNKIRYKEFGGKSTGRLLYKEDVISLVEKSEFVSLSTLSSYIGLNHGQCRKLVEKGLILGHCFKHKDKKNNVWLVDRNDMETYFNSFFKKMSITSNVDKNNWVSFKQAVMKLKVDSSSLISFISKNKFQACLLNGERRIDFIYVNLKQVDVYLERLKLAMAI